MGSQTGAPSAFSGSDQPLPETLRLRSRGVVTLPKKLREKYDLGEGEALRLVDLGGVFALTPMRPMVPELAREIERMREEAGLSTEELLESLRAERRRSYEERYAGAVRGFVEEALAAFKEQAQGARLEVTQAETAQGGPGDAFTWRLLAPSGGEVAVGDAHGASHVSAEEARRAAQRARRIAAAAGPFGR